ncbi:hypothetical protein AVO42_09225 [Thiomicrospira sp. XS5]|uniref:UDP-N-acetylglucosamine 2-epimerase n=1 Tax=Thiomicrospira sp. XS5 TaxID=1775636 RepID=UPI000748B23E|nr:UDP-N-acetylglucosamine 2-epimerase [Thiomicrospira sp. XS5]KUJ75491.1 hypothetical protein AVO42_09225 [Thiomicrospira sp. XS5]
MISRQKKIAVVTATRAEYGLLSRVIRLLEAHTEFDCQLWVTGAHLVEAQGLTVNEIRQAGHHIAGEVPILDFNSSDSNLDIALTTSRALAAFAKVLDSHRPDALLILGDRYEMLGIASAALLLHIPIIHLHGGEVTEGAVDESIRHALTKMASVHFVAAEPYRQRVIQMGENPERVFNVGATGLDVIDHLDYLTISQLERELDMSFSKPLMLVTYHPVTRRNQGTEDEEPQLKALQALMQAVESFPDATVIWTASNTDSHGQAINRAIQAWDEKSALNVKCVASLGIQRYLSLMKLADVVVGNSSSGIIEAPAMGVPTVNIGERQKGRLRSASVIDCFEDVDSISEALHRALSPDMQRVASQKNSVYGRGQTAENLVAILHRLLVEENVDLSRKSFYDVVSFS